MANQKVYAGSALAANFKGNQLDKVLMHAVSDSPVALGRLKREPGEAFCNKKIEIADEGSWQPGDQVDCPTCLTILARHA